MLKLDLPIQKNPLQTRRDFIDAVNQVINPLKPYYSKGRALLEIGSTGAGYSDSIAGMEGFSRVLWGLVPLLAGGEESEIWDDCLQGIKNGTNPSHEEYWGEITDFHQKAVEMAAFGYCLALTPEKVWEPLNNQEKGNLYSWLNQINQINVYDCNWLFFPVLVNLGFKRVGLPYDQEKVKENLDRIDQFYLGEGWYADGKEAHCDYYGPFAIHFYSLLYSALMGEEDPIRAVHYKSRAESYAKDFIYWFSSDGSALPYGRSLTYRFAQSAFWSALVYAGAEPFPLGVMKGLILRNLRWWFSQPIFDSNGLLTIGYRYPNLIMAENYNSPGSPYWALKTFLPLALTENHPFWQAEELPLPVLKQKVVQPVPRFIMCRQEDKDHIVAFNAGYQHTNDHSHTAAKYEKFVYSNVFGFSVSKAEWGLGQSAFDSMLAVSEGDNIFRGKRKCEEYTIDENVIYTKWKPWEDVVIRTWIVAGAPWHIRIHCIETSRGLDVADGGFALGLEHNSFIDQKMEVLANKQESLAILPWGASGIKSIFGNGQAEVVYPNANTNLMNARTIIPSVKTSFKPGKHCLVNAVFGEPSGKNAINLWGNVPHVVVTDGEIIIGEGLEKITIPIGKED
ncbi:DUF2264 domain-containing protein [Neobacillus drentensis]|uniref:DUF2264 domain-containing protein n=1 Tax=Neobacillus drentensis TaxID=220684 RepID=UPI001F29FEFD|nr:DUF2264 domain-containing protein [Neobacillus drentensis]ULT57495.1 DUF2264 domain-containing protein [Neobacillus drentensis]